MFNTFTKIFGMFILGILINLSLTGCGSSSNSNTPTPTPPIETVKLATVKVTPVLTFVEVGETAQYTATAIFDDGSTEDVTSSAEWRVSDTNISIVDANGTATGISVGSVTLAATYSKDGIEKTGGAGLDVVESEDNVTFSSLEVDGVSQKTVGETTQLDAIATLSDSTEYIVNDKVNWTSSDTAIATIDTTGMVSAIATGDVVMTATAKVDNAIVATHNLKIVATEVVLASIQIELGANMETPQPITSLEVPITEEVYITAWGIYSDGTREYINTDAIWWSDDQQIASINFFKSSKVYGRDLGTTTVTAYYGGLEASIPVTVVNNGPALTSIELISRNYGDVTDGAFTLPQGDKEWLTAYGNYEDGTREDINRYVAYSSSDTNVTFVIDEIDSNVYGRSPGTADISATWQGVSAKVTVTVTASTIEIQEGCSASETVVIDDSNALELSVGEEKCINAWLVHEDGTKERVTTTAFWLSQGQSTTASMDLLQRSSYVTGVAVGSTTVSATLEGITGIAPVNVSAYIPGTIRRSNFVNVDDLALIVATPPTSATGKADGTGGFYYTASTDGTYSAGDLVKDTDFEYAATMGTVKLFVNVYTTQDTNCPTERISVGIGQLDPTAYGYETWNDAKTDPDLAMCELRNFSDSLRVGNFYLRFGDSSYDGTDSFSLDSYIVN